MFSTRRHFRHFARNHLSGFIYKPLEYFVKASFEDNLLICAVVKISEFRSKTEGFASLVPSCLQPLHSRE